MKKKKGVLVAAIVGIACVLFFLAGKEKTEPITEGKEVITETQAEKIVEDPAKKFAMMDEYTTDGDAYAYFETDQGYVYLHAIDPVKAEEGKVYSLSANVISVDDSGNEVNCGYITANMEDDYLRSDGKYLYTYIGSRITQYNIKDNIFNIVEEFEVEISPDGTERYRYVKDNVETHPDSDTRYMELVEYYKTLSPIEFTQVGNGDLILASDWHDKIIPSNP